jgi:hypothetical protein
MISFSMIFLSCEKEETLSQNDMNEKILSFKSYEEFNQTLQKVNAMSVLERKTWETENDFKSFGTLCEEFYNNIDFESLKTIDQVKAIDSANIYLKIFQESGEYFIERNEMSTEVKYLINNDRMFIIGNIAYKFFDSNIISTDAYNLKQLANVKSFEDAQKNTLFTTSNSIRKAKEAISMEEIQQEVDNGYFLTKVRIQTENFWSSFPQTTKRETEFDVKNYKNGIFGWYLKKIESDWDIDLISWDDISNQSHFVNEIIDDHLVDSYNRSLKVYMCDGWTNDYYPMFSRKMVFVSTAAGIIQFN